jgi:hypothetical protein
VLAATSAQLVVCGAVALFLAIALIATLRQRAKIASQKYEKAYGLAPWIARSISAHALGPYVAAKIIVLIFLQTCLPLSNVSSSFRVESGEVCTQVEPIISNRLRQNSGELEQATQRESARDPDQESALLVLQPCLKVREYDVGLPSLRGRSILRARGQYSQSLPQSDGLGPPNARAPPQRET